MWVIAENTSGVRQTACRIALPTTVSDASVVGCILDAGVQIQATDQWRHRSLITHDIWHEPEHGVRVAFDRSQVVDNAVFLVASKAPPTSLAGDGDGIERLRGLMISALTVGEDTYREHHSLGHGVEVAVREAKKKEIGLLSKLTEALDARSNPSRDSGCDGGDLLSAGILGMIERGMEQADSNPEPFEPVGGTQVYAHRESLTVLSDQQRRVVEVMKKLVPKLYGDRIHRIPFTDMVDHPQYDATFYTKDNDTPNTIRQASARLLSTSPYRCSTSPSLPDPHSHHTP